MIRKTMKIGSRNLTDSLMPRRFSTISSTIAANSTSIFQLRES